jgi:serine/threonine protein kinase
MKFTYAPGDRPVEGYTLRHGIGRGGFGEVYAGVSDGGKEVALKLVQRNLEVELRGVGQCLNLKHPNLVALYDVKTAENGDCWVIMEYVVGQTLEKVIAQNPQGMPPEEFLPWIQGICEGVGYLHDEGIVHRDLKPGNLFLEKATVKVGDYGLSKFMSASRRSGQTASIGTVHYMAPEVVQGRYGKEVDLYSIGIILYEMLTGRVPFDGDSPGEILMKHLTSWPDLNVLQPSYRPVIARLLEKDPQRRYPSMQEMLADLNACAGQPVVPIPPTPAQSPTRLSIHAPREREMLEPVLPSAVNRGSLAPEPPNPRYLSARDRLVSFFVVALLIGPGAGILIFVNNSPGKEAFLTGVGSALLISGGILLFLLFLQWIAGWFRPQSKKVGTSHEAGTHSRLRWAGHWGVSLLFGVGTGTLVFGMFLASISGEGTALQSSPAKSERFSAATAVGFGTGFFACALSAGFFLLRQRGKNSSSELVDTPQPAKTIVPASKLQPTGPWHPPAEES